MRIEEYEMKRGVICSLLLLVVLLGTGNAVLASLPMPKDTNVLLITIDTLRYDRVSILSDRYVKTPNLDRLARRSAVFTKAYAHNPLTRPSHANIMTGTTALYHGVSDNPSFRLESRYLTLAEHLKENNYRNGAFIGAFVLDSRFGLNRGFDLYNDYTGIQEFGKFDFVERPADQVVQPAIEWIAGQKDKWFSWIHVFDPHDPYTPPEPFKTEYPQDPYSGEVAFVDAQLGILFDFLEKRNLLEKTVVIITSDHGEAFGEKGERTHGFFAYNNTIHIPLFLFYPGVEPKMVGENACHIDIFPTVCDLLGLAVPQHIQGESLLPLIAGRERQKKQIYFESLSPHFRMDCAPLRGFIQGNIKFIDLPIKEVYNLDEDPQEEMNLSSTSDIPRLVKDLETLMKIQRGRGARQKLDSKDTDILAKLKSLGYISGTPTKKKIYGNEDDLKSLAPVISHLFLAVEEFKAKKTDQAIKKLNTVIRIRPTYSSAYSCLAFFYYNLGQTEQGLATLKQGLTRIPGDLQLTSNLGIMLVMANKANEAIKPLEYCTKIDKFNPDNFNYLGRALMATKNYSRAEKSLNQALKLNTRMVPAYSNLGYLYLILYTQTADEKYYSASIKNFDEALALNPRLVPALKGKERILKLKKQK
jgi:arylsulfatase A-like enzyme/Flp pilus assembly protein TadD